MKISDLKEKLFKEIDAITPDVYSRVKEVPINKLLTPATPKQQFEQKLATRILATLCVIFVVLTVTLFGYFMKPDDTRTAPPSDSYVQITVVSHDTSGNATSAAVYGFVFDKNRTPVGGKLESASPVTALETASDLNGTIAKLIFAVGDSVTVVVLNDNDGEAVACSNEIAAAVGNAFLTQNIPAPAISSRENSSSDTAVLVGLINSYNPSHEASLDLSVDVLTLMYLSVTQ